MEEAAAVEGEAEVEEAAEVAEVVVVEEEQQWQAEEQQQQEEGMRNFLEQNHLPSMEIDKTSTDSSRIFRDICP